MNGMVQTMDQIPIDFPSSNNFELLLYFRNLQSFLAALFLVSFFTFRNDIVAHVNLALVP